MQNTGVSYEATKEVPNASAEITSDVAAQLLFVRSRTTIRNYIDRGQLPASMRSHTYYLNLNDLYAFAISQGKPTERIETYAKQQDIKLSRK